MNSVVLDVAIGMVFIYLLLSLIASAVQEIFATFIQLRSANLERALRSLFSGDSITEGRDLVESLYDHGLIRGLYQDPSRDQKADNEVAAQAAALAAKATQAAQNAATRAGNIVAAAAEDGAARDALIAAYNEAKAHAQNVQTLASLANMVTKTTVPTQEKRWNGLRRFLRKKMGINNDAEKNVVSDPILLPAYIPSSTFALALIDLLNQNKVTGAAAMAEIKTLLVERAKKENKAAQAMLALATDADGKIDTFQKNLEDWYNAAMDRASGWYKRDTQKILLVIGVVIAVALNVDTVHVARTLWTDRDVRTAMTQAATDYTNNHKTLPMQTATLNSSDLSKNLQNSVDAFQQVADQATLPVGWQPGGTSLRQHMNNLVCHPATSVQHGLAAFFRLTTFELLFGWGMTAVAISLGAPFWFDTLNRFMVVRGTVKPAEKSQTEASKDATSSTSSTASQAQ